MAVLERVGKSNPLKEKSYSFRKAYVTAVAVVFAQKLFAQNSLGQRLDRLF